MFKKADHLTDQQLIRFIDAEMPSNVLDQWQKHLVACTDCRLRRESLEHAAAEFASVSSHTQSTDKLRARLKTNLAATRRSAPLSLRQRFSIAISEHLWAYVYTGLAVAALSITTLNLQGHLFKTPSLPQLEAQLLPDSGLTPGATRPVGLADICMQDNNDNDLDPAVSASVKQAVFQAYGVSDHATGDYQVDYLINPQLGGTDDVHNLWPEPYGSKVWNAHAKDALETRLHHMVCEKQIDLASAQREIATNWIAAYKKYFRMTNPS
jgi:hypothetical protein